MSLLRSSTTVVHKRKLSDVSDTAQDSSSELAVLTYTGNTIKDLVQGARIKITEKAFTVGRDGSASDLRILDKKVSRTHFRIEYNENESDVTKQFSIRDLSTNGTYVNGKQIKSKNTTYLHSGDIIAATEPLESQRIPKGSKHLKSPENAGSSSSQHTEIGEQSTSITAAAESSPDGIAFIFRITSMATSNAPNSAKKEKTQMSGLVESLTCTICADVMYHAVSITPCMHSFCRSCMSNWYKRSTTCPECRGTVQQVNRNHTLDSMIDSYYKAGGEGELTASEKSAKEALETIPLGKVLRGDQTVNNSDEDESDSDEDSDDDDDYVPVLPSTRAPVSVPFVPRVNVPNPQVENAVEQFKNIAGVSESVARTYVGGAWARGLQPLLDRALSYYYEQQGN